MDLNLNPEALHAIHWVCGAAAWIVTARTVYQLAHLRAQRRKDAAWAKLCAEALASGKPFAISNDTISNK